MGTADKVAEALSSSQSIPAPEYSIVQDFSAVLALYDIAQRLGIREIIERHTGKREQGLPVSDSILLAAINRAVMPKSKNTFFSWFERTVLSTCFPNANKTNLSSQGFWNNMSQLNQDMIRSIEDDITKIVVDRYKVSTECMLFDNTNFFTYIDTDNQATLAQRGHSKEKRSDLKIVGLSLMVFPDHNIPLLHETYPGNRNDAKRFSEIIDKLKRRYLKIYSGDCNVTLVFDRGNNSEDNIDDILNADVLPFHFVGGLKLNQCGKLLTIPKEEFTPLLGDSFKKTIAYRTTMKVYGRDFVVVMTYNPELYKSQLRGVANNIEKCTTQLSELQKSLKRWVSGEVKKGRKPSESGVTKRISAILSAEHMKDVFEYAITQDKGFVTLSFSLKQESLEKLKCEVLGRSFLFTDHTDWSNEQIVSAYRSQYHVEEAFKRMKDTKYLSFRPIYHFTDSKIRVHAFYCVLAYLLTCLLNRELEGMGYKMSINSMLDCFQAVQRVTTVFLDKTTKKEQAVSSYSNPRDTARVYIERYNLSRYL